MSISPDYVALLDHLGATRPVRDLLDGAAHVVALRHDIDHDLDLALEMAFLEWRRGARATYFLLPTAAYWHDERLLDYVAQLDDYGHEVGLHLNVVAEWVAGSTDDPAQRLAQQLARLRSADIDVVGVSAHGDPLCYRRSFSNRWCLADLRPRDPATAETGLSAEGVPTSDPDFRLRYPADHRIRREDGAVHDLWQLRLADFGLTYEAVATPLDAYFTDSGGGWKRSPDPRRTDLSHGRHQVLVHPEHWRGEQRLWLVLSTARSGSTWMAAALDRASSVGADHEFSLNHRVTAQGEVLAEKRTGVGFPALVEDPSLVRQLLAEARAAREAVARDHVEANVYLVHVLDAVREIYPDTPLMHLHREPREVVRSLLERDWYDTPEDDRHPVIDVDGWDGMGQFERCCWYVRRVNEVLLEVGHGRLALDLAVADPSALVEAFAGVGLAVHARLLGEFGQRRVNASTGRWVAAYDEWPAADRDLADRILEPIRERLGYRPSSRPIAPPRVLEAVAPEVVTRLDEIRLEDLGAVGCELLAGIDGIEVRPDRTRHSYVVVGGGVWARCLPDQGWPVRPGTYVRVEVAASGDAGQATLFGLVTRADGSLLQARRLGPLTIGVPTTAAFRPRPDGARYRIAVHMPQGAAPEVLSLRSIRLEEVSSPRAGRLHTYG